VSVWSVVPLFTSPVPFSPTYLSVRTFACAPCVARIVWPASSRIVWPAFTPQCKPALALALAPAPARPARPHLGAVCVPSVCARTGRRRACLPRLPDSLQPFPTVSPERGGAFGSPPPANRLSFIQPRDSFAEPRDSPTRDPARAGATVGCCLPAVRACQVWGLGVQHRRRSLDDCPPFSLAIWGWAKEAVFFQVPRRPRL
jgi:hypothetical protein